MDNFTLTCLVEICPGLFWNFMGVALSDNFFWVQNIEQLVDSAAAGGEIVFYQIVSSAAHNELGQHWILLLYIVIHDHTKKCKSKLMMLIIIWDLLDSPIKKKLIKETVGELFFGINKEFPDKHPFAKPWF